MQFVRTVSWGAYRRPLTLSILILKETAFPIGERLNEISDFQTLSAIFRDLQTQNQLMVIGKSDSSTQLTVRRILVTTAAIAVGLTLARFVEVPLPFRLLGIAFGAYWSATCIFSFSTSLSSPAKEALFLFGLPLYICCIVCAAVGCLLLVMTIIGLSEFLIY